MTNEFIKDFKREGNLLISRPGFFKFEMRDGYIYYLIDENRKFDFGEYGSGLANSKQDKTSHHIKIGYRKSNNKKYSIWILIKDDV